MSTEVEELAVPTPKHAVLVGRKWGSPEITIDVTRDGIAIGMSLDDFTSALLEEIGSPTLIFRQQTFEDRVRLAVRNVVDGMKAETDRVV